MKNILLLVHDDAGQEARLQAALDIGRALQGHLTCLDVAIVPSLVGADYVGDAGFNLLLADEREREATNRSVLEARLADEEVPWDWSDVIGELPRCLENASGLADLIVVNRELDGFPLPDMRTTAGELIVRSNKPVLAVPESLRRFDFGAALVAWDGSPAAAAALRAAVPLLKLADRVVIVEIDDRSVIAPAEDAAAYLSRHDIHPIVQRVARSNAGTAQTLLDLAASGEFGYVVMGGFSHQRFLEALFGGVTRTMLGKSPVPLFLAH